MAHVAETASKNTRRPSGKRLWFVRLAAGLDDERWQQRLHEAFVNTLRAYEYAYEIGPRTGYAHFHIVLKFLNYRRNGVAACKKLLARDDAHVEVCRSERGARFYLRKDLPPLTADVTAIDGQGELGQRITTVLPVTVYRFRREGPREWLPPRSPAASQPSEDAGPQRALADSSADVMDADEEEEPPPAALNVPSNVPSISAAARRATTSRGAGDDAMPSTSAASSSPSPLHTGASNNTSKDGRKKLTANDLAAAALECRSHEEVWEMLKKNSPSCYLRNYNAWLKPLDEHFHQRAIQERQ